MPATPLITLTAKLADVRNIVVGATGKPSILRITLCGFGNVLPCIPGTCNIDKPGPIDIRTTNGTISIPLFGNDVIFPANTYYAIELLDDALNAVMTGAYQFTGSGAIDLSSAPQILQPAQANPWLGYLALTWTGSGSLVLSGQLAKTFDVTLQANAAPTITNLVKGDRVQFIIAQDGAGGHTWTWPANVKNPPLVSTDSNAITTANFIMRADGNLYPVLGWS